MIPKDIQKLNKACFPKRENGWPQPSPYQHPMQAVGEQYLQNSDGEKRVTGELYVLCLKTVLIMQRI